MEALVEYKGSQILIKERETVRVPYQKDLKPGSTVDLDQVLYFDDGKKKHIGTPYLKTIAFKVKVDSHGKDKKIVVFKKKRRKGYQKKNGHKQPFTLLKIDKLKVAKKEAPKVAKKATQKTKKIASVTTKVKKTTKATITTK